MTRRKLFLSCITGAVGLMWSCGKNPLAGMVITSETPAALNLLRVMDNHGFILRMNDTSLGKMVDGIYYKDQIGLIPIVEADVSKGEGLIYTVEGKPFPAKSAIYYLLEVGSMLTWGKKSGGVTTPILTIKV